MLPGCWAGSSVGTSVRLKSGRSAVRPRPCPPLEAAGQTLSDLRFFVPQANLLPGRDVTPPWNLRRWSRVPRTRSTMRSPPDVHTRRAAHFLSQIGNRRKDVKTMIDWESETWGGTV